MVANRKTRNSAQKEIIGMMLVQSAWVTRLNISDMVLRGCRLACGLFLGGRQAAGAGELAMRLVLQNAWPGLECLRGAREAEEYGSGSH